MTEIDLVALRDGAPSDCEAVAALHLASWRDSYRGLLPDAYLDGALAEDLAAKWQERLAPTPGRGGLLLLAESDARLGGFIYACQEANRPDSAYIDNLHVAADSRGRGLGARLMRDAARRLGQDGYYGAHLRVFAANEAAVRFYLRLGAHVAHRGPEDLMGHTVETYRMEWPDLSVLI
ncbi:GNAT family N-acetyltransferase [Algihabitans albus]|uniref:GNAT family N-acetyltransferase n=1 Tax=Algihabitans albus TaxID=2164067 RepID=UPI0013C2A234|nr:GNAT family N-acetyltransferase [Algihabitans albus]